MKNALIISYVVGVLLFSGFARAEESTVEVPIQKINYQEGNWSLEIHGELRNNCLTSPKAELFPSKTEANTFIMKILANKSGDMCAMVVSDFRIDSDLRTLLRKSDVFIQPHVTYTVKTEEYPFEVSFTGSEVVAFRLPEQPIQLMGVLMKTPHGQKAVFTDSNELVLVDDSQVDAEPFVNQEVAVTGHFGPLQATDQGYTSASRRQKTLPVLPTQRLMVTEIQPLVR